VRALVAILVGLTFVSAAAATTNPREPKKKIIPAVQAKAKAVNVQLSDLPTGLKWTPKPPSKDSSSPHCSYYNPDQSDLTENGDIDSPEFTLASGSYVASSTGIFQTATQGRTAYTRVVQPALPKCLAEIFRKGSGQPQNVKIVSAAPIAFPRLAERSNAYRIFANFTVQSTVVKVYLDLVVMNRGKVDVVIFFAGIGGSYNAKFEQGIATRVAARMAQV
jgi:hypothetical protein